MKTVALGEVAAIERQGVDPSSLPPDTPYLGLEHIERGGRIVGHETVGQAELASTKFVFASDHVLFGKLRPNLGKVSRPPFSGVCSTDILPIRPGPNLNRDYLAHYLLQPTMIEFASSRTAGANLPRLSPTVLGAFPIPLPPVDEQLRLAAILDFADSLRFELRASIELAGELSRAVFLDMFGDPVTNQANWPRVRVQDICTLVRGSSPRPQGDPRYFGGPVARLMISDITRDGKLVTPRTDSLTVEGAKRSRPCSKGTIVMAVSGNIGLVSQLAIDACIHDGFVGFTELKRNIVRPKFLLDVLDISKRVHEISTAGAIFKNITTTDIKALELVSPPLEEQDEYCRRVSAVEKFTGIQRARSVALDALFANLRARAFSGQL